MKMNLKSRKAFTLIELLVVITIIGILASFAIPTIGSAIAQANQTRDLNNITQTGRTLFMDANDNGGTYRKTPSGSTAAFGSSTDAFQSLLTDGALTTASVLAGTGLTVAPDITNLQQNNVAWAYMLGVRTSSNPSIPLLLSYGSGFTAADLTTDTPKSISTLAEGLPSDGGALWANKAVLGYYVGGNAKIMKPGKDGAPAGAVRIMESEITTPPAGALIVEP